jgi:hypothetical protein
MHCHLELKVVFCCVFAADSWPQVFDDSEAREDWNWRHEYDINKLVTTMIEEVSRQQRLREAH